MSDSLQWVGLISAIVGWATVIIGGLRSWTALTNKITELQGKTDALDKERLRCQGDECKRMDDHEERIRSLEKSLNRDPNSRTRKSD